jgi:hypothetical protein
MVCYVEDTKVLYPISLDAEDFVPSNNNEWLNKTK